MTTVHNTVHNTLKQIYIKQIPIYIEKEHPFHVGNWVLVDNKNLQIKAGSKCPLTNKWIGPYEVTTAIGSHTYQLEVLHGTQWHNVVYYTLFKPFLRKDKSQDIEEDKDDAYKVESIISSKRNRGVIKYRVI